MRTPTKVALGIAMTLLVGVSTPLLAAQGQITEVNPSGVHGKVKVILQADEGVVEVTFVNPRAFQDGYKPQLDDIVDIDVVKIGKKTVLVTIKRSTTTTTTGSSESTGAQ